MRATLRECVGQESGFVLCGRECFLDNWVSDLDEYTVDKRKTRKINSVLSHLIQVGAVEQLDEEPDYAPAQEYNGCWYVTNYIEYAMPVTIAELDVPGTRYDFNNFVVITPDGWN